MSLNCQIQDINADLEGANKRIAALELKVEALFAYINQTATLPAEGREYAMHAFWALKDDFDKADADKED